MSINVHWCIIMQIEDIPEMFGDFFDISTEASQVFLSIVVILAVLLPVMLMSRGSKSVTIEAVVLFLTMCFLIGIGWLPFWILIMAVLIIAIFWAGIGADMVSGE